MSSLANKVALVTGVTLGVRASEQLSRSLWARAGADVATAYYRPYDRTMPWVSRSLSLRKLWSGYAPPVFAPMALKSTLPSRMVPARRSN